MRNAILSVLIGLAAGFLLLRLFAGSTPEAPEADIDIAREAAVLPAAAATAPPATAPLVRDTLVVQSTPHARVDDEPSDEPAPEPAGTADRIGGLVAVGFSPARAAEILQREAELRRNIYAAELATTASIQPLYAATRNGGADQLRAELGDSDYARYLAGTGQPHSVIIEGVDANSAAEQAGLVPGDEIVSYAGQRVFNQRDLNLLMLAGLPGEIVATTVVRNGQTLQLYVTRGPLGLL